MAALGLAALASGADAQTNTPKAAAPAPKVAAPKAVAPVRSPKADDVLATVNGDPITRADLVNVLSGYQIAPGTEQEYYNFGIDTLINGRLLSQFLRDQKIVVDPKEIQEQIDQQDKNFKANGSSLIAALAEHGTTMEEFKSNAARTLQWKKYILARATDAELKKYLEQNKELFDGSLVSARHILIEVDSDASAEKKDEARKKLLAIKKEIESGAITFPNAANKYSDDHPEGESPNGGDLGSFPRRGRFIEPFVAAAFALKPGEISEPIETEYGFHLIQVTDRTKGRPIDFAQFHDRILESYARDAQEEIVASRRKTAKIDIKPMPADLFPPRPVTPPAANPATQPAAPTGAAKAKTAPK
jgi:peptidyl-prolyl cis-trans isomerase C